MLAGLCLLIATSAHAQQPAASTIDPVVGFVHALGDSYTVQPNLTYSTANNVELKLDLYLPRNSPAAVPLVLFFHGGGWVEGRKEAANLYLLPYLQMGFAVANVGYRLGRVSPAPAAVEDTRCALRWLSRRARDYKLDMNKVVLTGGSAGAHLALITGMLPPGHALHRAGVPQELITVRGGRHGSFAAPEVQRIALAMAAFLARQGIHPAPR